MQLQGTSRRLPIYLVLDTSGSMSGAPIQAVNNGLKEFEAVLKKDPQALETAYLSVISFDSAARVVTPLVEVGAFVSPTLSTGGLTCLGAALTLLTQTLDNDFQPKSETQPGDWKPLVFIFTDGGPTDAWEAPLTGLRDSAHGKSAQIFAIGCGGSADSGVLKRITENVIMSADLSSDRISALFAWISQSIATAAYSVSLPAGDSTTATLPPPPAGFQITL